MLRSATEHYERQAAIAARALLAARRRRWTDANAIATIVALFQLEAAQDALDSIGPMLDEQDIQAEPVGYAPAAAFAGTASDGRPLTTLFEQASSPEALGVMVVTQVQDMARAAAGVGIVARPRVGYVRMLNPPSCSRCAILAGRFYRWSSGFQRHPRCDCRHIPTRENIAGDLTTDPRAYYDSLDEAGRIKFAGSKANYQAIEDGADMNQIVNIYRQGRTGGLGLAQPASPLEQRYGLKFTTSGSTDRSVTFQQQVGLGLREARRSAGTNVRLMPESIYANATSREEALQMLRANGYLIDAPAQSAGRAALDATRRVERAERRRDRRAERRQALRDQIEAPNIDDLRELVRQRRARRSQNS